MKNNILFIVPLSVLAIGCAPQKALVLDSCVSGPDVDQCTGSPNNPKININVSGLSVSPPNVCVKKGTAIEVKITGSPADKGSVATVPKDLADTWIFGSNGSSSDTFFLYPNATVASDRYEYSIVKQNGDCLDPRITVDC